MVSLVLAGNNPALTAAQYVAQGFGIFFHFSMSTFTNVQYAAYDADPDLFAPSSLSFNQWLDAVEAAGAKYVVPVFKHQDGFTLWDSAEQPHNVAHSAGFAGRNLLHEFYLNARGRGLWVVPYLSVLDQRWGNDNPGATNAQYLQHTKNILTEMHEQCPLAAGIWTDAWGWSAGYSAVDWTQIRNHMRSLWPRGLLIENNHEHSLAHTDIAEWEIPFEGDVPADNVLLAEACDSIFAPPYWFWNNGVTAALSASDIRTAVAREAARGATFLLNCGPNNTGQLGSDITDVLEAV